MKILTLVKSVLESDTTVAGLLSGRVWIQRVDENDARPNILLRLMEDADEWSHDGPDGLQDAHLEVHSRGDADSEAGNTGSAVKAALNEYTGSAYGMTVHFLQHFNTRAEYDDARKVFVQVDEFRVVYRSA